MIEDIVGSNGTKFVIAAAAVAAGLLCLVVVFWFMRNRPSSPFLRGGKNRQPRLAVLDAAAVDTRRRLVLVRRDDVEHLIMIGGPTDIVIESRIMAAPITEPVQTRAQPTGERRPPPQQAAVPQSQAQLGPVQQGSQQHAQTRQPDPKLPPVSAMGQALYGDVPTTQGNTIAEVRAAAAAAPRVQPVAIARQPGVERTPSASMQHRPASVQSAVPVQPGIGVSSPALAASALTVNREIARTPEDILDAARARVLPASLSGGDSRSGASTDTARPVVDNTVKPVATAEPRKDVSAADFESFLDAEITGDLGRLPAGTPARTQPDQRAITPAQGPAGAISRQEPRLEPVAVKTRAEPSLEEEMNRMLNEISATRKN